MTGRHDEQHEPRRRRGFFARIRASFLTGLVVIAPIAVTIWLVWTVIGWIDGWVIPLIPQSYRPEQYIGVNLRGVGVVIFLIFTVIVGWMAKGLIGRSLINWAEGLVDRMPIVRSVYNGLKQIAETVFAQTETSFDKACLVQYPRPGIWAIAFISTSAKGELARKIGGRARHRLGLPADDAEPDVGLPALCPARRRHRTRHVGRGRGEAHHLGRPRLSGGNRGIGRRHPPAAPGRSPARPRGRVKRPRFTPALYQ